MQAVHRKLKTGIHVLLKEAECADDLVNLAGIGVTLALVCL